MAVTAADIKAHFPEFGSLSTTYIDRWRLQAERRVNLTQWGAKADDGILWLSAHLLAISCKLSAGSTVAPGPVSSAKADGLSLSFAVAQKDRNEWLASTSYGQYFLDLQRSIFPTRVLGACCTNG